MRARRLFVVLIAALAFVAVLQPGASGAPFEGGHPPQLFIQTH